MIAIVTAGGEIQPEESLYAITHGGLKAMLDIDGKPMVQWVLDALSASREIEGVIVVGLPPETDLDCSLPLRLIPNQGDIMSNIRAGAVECMRMDPASTHAIVATADIPALRGEMVDWLALQTKKGDRDVYFTVLERTLLEKEYPGIKRTYVHLKDSEVCSGELHCFRLQTALQESPLWDHLVDARKSPFRQASLLGYDTLFFLTLRQLSLKDAEAVVSQRLGIKAQAIISPYPEIGMDVDKPAHLEFMRDYLARRYARSTASV